MRRLAWLVVGMAGTALVGCGPEETTGPSCGDPALGGVDEECGVWVSASLGSDDNPGTRAAPMASLSAAVLEARDRNRSVYACGDLWTEPLLLPSDVSLFGGFDCENGWKYGGREHRSRIETGPGQVPLKTEGDLGIKMVVADFRLQAADAAEPGGSSIAVIVGQSDAIQFRRCTLFAGRGADGLDGAVLDAPAAAGASGKPGADACTSADGPGGEPTATACDPGGTSQGGKGGSGGPLVATDGAPGMPAPPGDNDPNNPTDGDGGNGQTAAEACTAGEPGADGADGAPAGPPPTEFERGYVSIDGYQGIDGEDGKPGAPAQGGGGGGASRGGAAACGAATPGGAGGGSGGAGGCGGKGGKGGQAGGSSFAILVLASIDDVSFASCDLWIQRAGDGGDGAPGQPGGEGGDPGEGGAAAAALQPGCQGGKGGKGGKGGGGGGGDGGHSVYIAFRGNSGGGPWPDTSFQGDSQSGNGGDGGDALAPNGHRGASIYPPNTFSFGFQQ